MSQLDKTGTDLGKMLRYSTLRDLFIQLFRDSIPWELDAFVAANILNAEKQTLIVFD